MEKENKIIGGSLIAISTIGILGILLWYTQNVNANQPPKEEPIIEKPGKPTNLTLQLTPNKIQLYIKWDAPTTGGTATNYHVYRNNVLINPAGTIGGRTNIADFYDGLKSGIYVYQVSAVNEAGEGEKSDIATIQKV